MLGGCIDGQGRTQTEASNSTNRAAFASASMTPLVRIDDGAGQHRSVGFKSLSDHGQAEPVESSEGGQIGTVEAGRRG